MNPSINSELRSIGVDKHIIQPCRVWREFAFVVKFKKRAVRHYNDNETPMNRSSRYRTHRIKRLQ